MVSSYNNVKQLNKKAKIVRIESELKEKLRVSVEQQARDIREIRPYAFGGTVVARPRHL